MTNKGTSCDRSPSTGYAKSVSRVAGCSATYPVQFVEGILKPSTVSPCRRSLRLKRINAICKSEDAGLNLQQQTSAVYKSFITNDIKVETPFEEDHVNDANDGGYNQKYDMKGSNTNFDVESITLRDLKNRCKGKKCKVQHSVASMVADHRNQGHDLLKPKEEEADLEEPLIVLKLKMSKKSAAERKRRKCEHSSSGSSDSVQGVTAHTCSFTSNSVEGVVTAKRELSTNVLATDANSCSCENAVYVAESVDLKVSAKLESSGGAEENNGAVISQNITKVDNLLPLSSTASKRHPIHSGSPQSILCLKNEIMEFDLWDEQGPTNDPVSSTSHFIVNSGDLPDDSAEFLQRGTGGSDNGDSIYFIGKPLHNYSTDLTEFTSQNCSPLSMYEPVTGLRADCPQLVYNVTEVLESDSPVDKNTVYISALSNEAFISGVNSPVTSPTKVERDYGSELDKGDFSCSATTGLHCIVNKSSTEYMESEDIICFSESEEHFGCASVVGCSEILSSSAFLVSTPKACDVGSSDIRERTENNSISLEETVSKNITDNMNHSAARDCSKSIGEDNDTYICNSSMVRKDAENLFHEVLEKEMAKSTQESDVVIDHSIKCTKIHHASDATLSDNKKSFCANMEQVLNVCTKVTNLIDVEGQTEVDDCHSCQTCSQFNTVIDSIQSSYDGSSITGEKVSPSVTEKIFYACADEATSYTLLTHSIEGQKVDEEELKFDHGVKQEHSPKKLFSNRKTISPTSQEKLCQALNGMDLDAMLISKNGKRLLFEKRAEKEYSSFISGCGEGDMMADSERMTKRLKSRRNDSILPVTKGILKSQDNSSKKSCSCMKSSLMQKQTQEAITFSQRQVRDFESVAMKLLKGLKSMREIVEGSLSSEALLSASSKFTADEIREATNNAAELEVTTNRWLSIFTRDCSRFYKIMRARENEAANSDNAVQKEGRKITFADEVGGLLCHVKVFESQPALVVADKGEKSDI